MNTTIERPTISPNELTPKIREAIDSPKDEVLERLILGRERVRKGWCQRRLHIDGRYCIIGATCAEKDATGTLALCEILRIVPGRSAMLYNDHPDTTQADAIALFDRAIAARVSPEEPRTEG